MLENPELVGIGIDEATAVVVGPNGGFEVVGLGTVTVYDARTAEVASPDREGLLSGRNLRLHVLRPGDRLELSPVAADAPN